MADRNQFLNDPETALRYALDGRQSQMWTAMPAIVQAVNRGAGTVDCAPAIKGVITDDNGVQSYVMMPPLLDCPVVFASAGGFTLSLPIKVGDEVLVIIASRCIDAWWQSGGFQQPIELRMHDLSDGFAIPGPKSIPNVPTNLSSTNARLSKDDGSVYLEITPDGGINMLAPLGVNITGNLTVSGIIAAEELTIDAITPTGGTLVVTGNIEASGEITAGIVPLSTHIHSGGTGPGGDTGGPEAP